MIVVALLIVLYIIIGIGFLAEANASDADRLEKVVVVVLWLPLLVFCVGYALSLWGKDVLS